MKLAGFLDALLDDPDDEASRLIFADWLQDQPDEALAARGEFLRVQTLLARWVPDLDQRLALQASARQLLAKHWDAWLGPLELFARDGSFDRGLLRLALPTNRFLSGPFARQAHGLLEQGWVEMVRLTETAAHRQDLDLMTDLVQAPQLAALPGLDLSGEDLGDDYVGALSDSPYLENLRRLDLADNRLTDEAARAIASSTCFPRLNRLDLRNNHIGPAGVKALLESSCLPRLRRLDLHGNDLTPAMLLEVAQWHEERGATPRCDGLPVRIVNLIGMELALVPAGTFLMGSPDDEPEREAWEGPQHVVTLSKPFYLGVYPVTQAQYAAVMNERPSHFTGTDGSNDNHPVERVTWNEAVRFCEELSRMKAEKKARRKYRLPTEAEWEHACRAGATTAFSSGPALLPHQANFDARTSYAGSPLGLFLQRTTQVGSFRPNAFGLYDMHGNVWEWCRDLFDQGYYQCSPEVDPTGPVSGNRVAVRGGSWLDTAGDCRCATRDYWYGYHYQRNTIGFRVVVDVAE
jgi:uncharacterized protein (TIGR02996 family)